VTAHNRISQNTRVWRHRSGVESLGKRPPNVTMMVATYRLHRPYQRETDMTSLPPTGSSHGKSIPDPDAFEFPFTDSGGRDTAAMQAYEYSAPLAEGMIRYHRFEHEPTCRVYQRQPCDCAVVMSVLDEPVLQPRPAHRFLDRLLGR
jgi:hypothetical protein